MEKRQFGRTDMSVSVLGFGGSQIGIKDLHFSRKEADRLLGKVLEMGINVLDTASSYNTSEELIGHALSGRRNEYYLFSKCGEAATVGLDYPDWDPRAVRPSVERSLKRLQTDYLDLVLIHSCTEAVLRQEELIEAVKQVKRDGLVRYIGYSGDSTDALYAIYTDAFDALETSVNVLDQEALDMTLDEAEKRGMGIIAKRPVANAVWSPSGEMESPDPYVERLRKLDYPFLRGDEELALETALRFTVSVPQVDTAIVGSVDADHIRRNAEVVAKGKLSDVEMRSIRKRWEQAKEPAWEGLI